MTIGVFFWSLWLIALIFGGVGYYREAGNQQWTGGYWLVSWVLFGLLGYAVFGSPLHR